MAISEDLKASICSLFEVYPDENGVQRLVTPLEYPGSRDNIVVRVRPGNGGHGFVIDENGEAALYSSLNGGDIESEAVAQWAQGLALVTPVVFTEDETLSVSTEHERLIAPSVFRVAEAAQQLYAVATARSERQSSDFKERVKNLINKICEEIHINVQSDVELPIAGGLKADHVLETKQPVIIVTATSGTRLLEAEVIFMQYRADKKIAYVLAIAENQASVGKKQYERAAYYTDKTVIFDPKALPKLFTPEGVSTQQ